MSDNNQATNPPVSGSSMSDQDQFALLKVLGQALSNCPDLANIIASAASGTLKTASDVNRERSDRYKTSHYYREKYARELQPVIDALLDTKKDQAFYLERNEKKRRNSIKSRINVSLAYLIDHLDPTKKYAEGRLLFMVTDEPAGIFLRHEHNIRSSDKLVAVPTDTPYEGAASVEWRVKLEDFLNSDPGPKGITEELTADDGVNLDDQGIEDLRSELDAIGGIIAIITHTKIKLVKLPVCQHLREV